MKNQRLRIQIVGPYPPPQGGISVHVQRLVDNIRASCDVEILDPYRRSADFDLPFSYRACGGSFAIRAMRLGIALIRSSPDIRHLHVSSFRAFAILGHLLRPWTSNSVVLGISIHSGSFPADYEASSPSRKRRLRKIIAGFDFVVAVNDEIAEIARQAGVPSKRVVTVPAFIPVQYEEDAGLANEVRALNTGGKKIIVASGYGLPLYGYHILLEALKGQLECGRTLVPIVCLYNTYDERYCNMIEKEIKELGGMVFRDLRPDEFFTVLRHCDIFVRPTDRDGDAVSVREALWLGKAVVASDCVERPEGAILFRNLDTGHLRQVLAQSLESVATDESQSRVPNKQFSWPDFYRRLMQTSGPNA